MSDTITCPNCSATLPSAASFCTTCGTKVASTPPPPPAPGPEPADQTRVDTPGLHDATQVYSPPTGSAPPSGSVPWQPAPPADASGPWAAPAPPAPPTGDTPAWVGSAQALSTAPPPEAPAWQAGGAPAAARQPSKPGSPLGAVLAVLGGVLTLVGIFLPWVTSNLSDAGLSGWDLTSGDNGFRLPDQSMLTFESIDPYFLVAIGAVALFAGVMALGGGTRMVSRVLGVVLGLAVIGLMVRDWTSMADLVQQEAPATFEIESAIGFYLTIAGGALLLVSAVMPSKASKSSSTPSPL